MITKNVTTLNLSGETTVQFDKGYDYFFVSNLSGNDVMISMSSGITDGADGVIIVPEGLSAGTMHGYSANTVYVKGTGKVQVMGTYSAFNPFKKSEKGGEIKTDSGSNITINSVDFPLLALTAYGRSTQDYASHGGEPLGKNLFDFEAWKNGITLVHNGTAEYAENSITLYATANDCFVYGDSSLGSNYKFTVKSNTTYTLSWTPNNNNDGRIMMFFNDDEYNMRYTHNSTSKSLTFTTGAEDRHMQVRLGVANAGESITYSNIQLEESLAATEYEPYYSNPNPDCPVPIENIGDGGSLTVTTCGKNLLDHVELTMTRGGVQMITNADGSITANGTATESIVIVINQDFVFEKGKKYILSSGLNANDIVGVAYLAIVNGEGAYPNSDVVVERDVTTTEKIAVVIERGTTVTNATFKPMVRLVGTDDTYEPYKSTTATITTALPLRGIPVSSGGNYTDSKGQEWVCDTIDYNYTEAVKTQRITVIDSYNGETVGDTYISTTGGLNVGSAVIYPAETVTETQLTADELNQLRGVVTFDNITNVYNNEGADMSVEYLTSKAVSKAVMPIITALRGDNNA